MAINFSDTRERLGELLGELAGSDTVATLKQVVLLATYVGTFVGTATIVIAASRKVSEVAFGTEPS